MSSERNEFYPNNSLMHTQRAYLVTPQVRDFLEAHKSKKHIRWYFSFSYSFVYLFNHVFSLGWNLWIWMGKHRGACVFVGENLIWKQHWPMDFSGRSPACSTNCWIVGDTVLLLIFSECKLCVVLLKLVAKSIIFTIVHHYIVCIFSYRYGCFLFYNFVKKIKS